MKMSGLEMKRIISGSYPPWSPNSNSSHLKIAKSAFKETFHKDPNIQAVHGGFNITI